MINPSQDYPHPRVFVVDAGGGRQPQNQYPYDGRWSFPPAQQVMRRKRRRSCMGVTSGLVLVVLLLFLLTFATMGFGTYKIFKLQKEVSQLTQVKPGKDFSVAEKQTDLDKFSVERGKGKHDTDSNAKEKQIGPDSDTEKSRSRAAAHVIGRIETNVFPNTLRWDPRVGRAFTTAGVTYQDKEGVLQVHEAGLYHVYSRVELTVKQCSTFTFIHSVMVSRAALPSPLTLMEDHKVGFCPSEEKLSWTKESYLASAVQLRKEDKVFVTVSHPRDVRHSQHANFFGLYQIQRSESP